MQGEHPFPSLQLIFLQKPVWAMKMLPLASSNYAQFVENFSGFVCSRNWWKDRDLLYCRSEAHSASALFWCCWMVSVKTHFQCLFTRALEWSECSLALLSPKLCLGITWLKVQCWSCSFGDMRPGEESQQPLWLLNEFSGFWWVVFVSLE